MNCYEFSREYGIKAANEIAIKSDTTPGYFRHLEAGRKVPGRTLAAKIEAASGGRITTHEMLFQYHRKTTGEAKPNADRVPVAKLDGLTIDKLYTDAKNSIYALTRFGFWSQEQAAEARRRLDFLREKKINRIGRQAYEGASNATSNI